MKSLITLFLSLFFVIPSFSQSIPNKEIEIQKTFLGAKFYLDGEKVSLKRLESVLIDVPQSYRFVQQAKTSNIFSQIFGFAGGFLIGYPIGTAIAGGDANWNLALAGAGCLAVSIPLAIVGTNKVVKAVDLYNQSKTTSHNEQKLELNFALTSNGVGLVVNF